MISSVVLIISIFFFLSGALYPDTLGKYTGMSYRFLTTVLPIYLYVSFFLFAISFICFVVFLIKRDFFSGNSKTSERKRSINGLSLTNVLVLLLILSVVFLAWLFLPFIAHQPHNSKLTSMAANGRNLVHIIAANNIWPKAGKLNPAEGKFDSSTSYFAWLVTNDIINVHWNFFAGEDVPRAQTEEEFVGMENREEGYYNAWCIVGNVDENTPGDTPVLFIKNLGKDGREEGSSYSELSMKKFATQESFDQLIAGAPFEDENGFVFVCKNGSAFAPFKEDMNVQNFTNIFVIPPEAENLPILRPNPADSRM